MSAFLKKILNSIVFQWMRWMLFQVFGKSKVLGIVRKTNLLSDDQMRVEMINRSERVMTRVAASYAWPDLPLNTWLPAEDDISANILSINDQLTTGTCVAQGTSSSSELTIKVHGVSVVDLSRLFMYYWGRPEIWRNEDGGTSADYLLYACETYGMPPESAWPFDISKVQVQPPPEVSMLALATKITGRKMIKSYAAQDLFVTIQRIKEAVYQGMGVLISMPLEYDFFGLSPSIAAQRAYMGMSKPGGQYVGNHLMYIVGYKQVGSEDYFLLVNSWGMGWASAGKVHLAMVTIATDALDLWVITGINGADFFRGHQCRRQATQLYVSIFGRAPEQGGLYYWASRLYNGETVTQLANEMFAVAPARAYYPNTDLSSQVVREQIVDSVYQNVLGRPATEDMDGRNHWLGRLTATDFGTMVHELLPAICNYYNPDQNDPVAVKGMRSMQYFNKRVHRGQRYAERGGDVAGATTVLSDIVY